MFPLFNGLVLTKTPIHRLTVSLLIHSIFKIENNFHSHGGPLVNTHSPTVLYARGLVFKSLPNEEIATVSISIVLNTVADYRLICKLVTRLNVVQRYNEGL